MRSVGRAHHVRGPRDDRSWPVASRPRRRRRPRPEAACADPSTAAAPASRSPSTRSRDIRRQETRESALRSSPHPIVTVAALAYTSTRIPSYRPPLKQMCRTNSCTALYIRLALALSAVVIPAQLLAQSPPPPTLVVGKLAAEADAPVIDGRVNEALWQTVQPYSTFTQQDPIEGDPASERTEVRVIVGKGNVYIGIIAFDSDPSKIIVSQARRDALAERNRLDRDGARHLQRQSERVRVRHQPARHRVRRPGRARGPDAAASRSAAAAAPAGRSAAASARSIPTGTATGRSKSQITERGWEAEMAIPLKTLRYETGTNQTWGFNVLRNIRHKNEQVYLAPIPRGFDIYRVSLAAKMSGLDLPARRDIKLIPYALGSVNKDFTRTTGDQVDKKGDRRPRREVGHPSEPDVRRHHQHRLRAGRGRRRAGQPDALRFVLSRRSGRSSSRTRRRSSSASPQSIDLFFSRRIGLSATGVPIDILGGARLSGKVGGWNVGVLNIQTDEAENAAGTQVVGPANNFSVVRVQREVGRSSYGAIFVNRQGTGSFAADRRLQPRLRRRRQHPALVEPAHLDLPGAHRYALDADDGSERQRLLGPRVLQLHQQPLAGLGRLLAGRRQLQPRGRLPAAARLSAAPSSARSSSRSRRTSSGFAASRRT